MSHVNVGLLALGLLVGSVSTSFADAFATAVENVLMQHEQITKLDPQRQQEMIACVVGVVSSLPPPTKLEIANAPDLKTTENLFGKAVMADQAKVKQKIAQVCGGIEMKHPST